MALTPQQQIEVIDRQISDWESELFNTEVAHRVHKRIGSEPARLEKLIDAMQKAEFALIELRAMRAELVDVAAQAALQQGE